MICKKNRPKPPASNARVELCELVAQKMDGKDILTFNQLRAAFGDGASMSDGELHQAAIDAGFDVER